jgi:hypothetical protein
MVQSVHDKTKGAVMEGVIKDVLQSGGFGSSPFLLCSTQELLLVTV